jgi:hypothetical protein
VTADGQVVSATDGEYGAVDDDDITGTCCPAPRMRLTVMAIIVALAVPLASYTAELLTSESPLAVLNVPTTATLTDVRHAWRRLAADLHPDRGGPYTDDEKEVRAQALDRVRTAYETIMSAGSVEAAAHAHQGPPLTMGLPEFLADPSLELYVLAGYLGLLLALGAIFFVIVRRHRPAALSVGFEARQRRRSRRGRGRRDDEDDDGSGSGSDDDDDPFSSAGPGVRLGGGGGDDGAGGEGVEPCPLCGESVLPHRLEAHVNRCLDAIEDSAAEAAVADQRCDDCTLALASHECPECGLWYCLECGSRLHRRGTFVSHRWASLVSPDVETLMAE